MAKSIRSIEQATPTEAELQAAALSRLTLTLTEHGEAVGEFLHLLELLRSRGFLGMATAVLEQGGPILKIIVDQAGKPDYAGGIKNVMALLQMLGSMDTSVLNGMVSAMGKAKEIAKAGEGVQVSSIFDVLKLLKDEQLMQGLSFMVSIVKAMGTIHHDQQTNHPNPAQYHDVLV